MTESPLAPVLDAYYQGCGNVAGQFIAESEAPPRPSRRRSDALRAGTAGRGAGERAERLVLVSAASGDSPFSLQRIQPLHFLINNISKFSAPNCEK